MRAGFAEVDLTPPLGTHKIGFLRDIVSDHLLDPLTARAAVLESGGQRIGWLGLDLLSVRWTQAAEIRRRVAERCGLPGESLMVAATHNHAGPAVAHVGDVPRDEAYVACMVERAVEAVATACASLRKAEIACGTACEWEVAHNRRVIMRDGTARTHGSFADPEALCLEGPIDPEVAVLAARAPGGERLGAVVNFTCHPVHEGGGTGLSGGYPAALAREMRARGCPVTVFLNGACGNVHHADPCRGGESLTREEIGVKLAEDVSGALEGLTWRADCALGSRSRTLELPYRQVSDEEARGEIRGAQRFIDPAIYDRQLPALRERIRQRGTQPAEVQALFVDEYAYVGIPAEYFVEYGLRLKEACYPRHALVVGHANGMVGYVPTRAAFRRGGYETTFAPSSRLAPEAGDLLADCAIQLVQEGPEP